jgi:hypothetical protein
MSVIQSITFGYSDSEDRLWVRCVLQGGGESRFWLTRRLALALIKGVTDKLADTLSPVPVPMDKALRLALEHQAGFEKPSDPAPPAPRSSSKAASEMSLCTRIDLTPGNKSWRIVWIAGGQPLTLNMAREAVHRMLAGLISRAQQAGWAPELPASWLKSEERERLLQSNSSS